MFEASEEPELSEDLLGPVQDGQMPPPDAMEVRYQNVYTGEEIRWRPRKPACREPDASPDVHPSRGLPAGWMAAESSSHPGEIVYENAYTSERINWRPKHKAARGTGDSRDLDPAADLPEGWLAVSSRTRMGELVYEPVSAITQFVVAVGCRKMRVRTYRLCTRC